MAENDIVFFKFGELTLEAKGRDRIYVRLTVCTVRGVGHTGQGSYVKDVNGVWAAQYDIPYPSNPCVRYTRFTLRREDGGDDATFSARKNIEGAIGVAVTIWAGRNSDQLERAEAERLRGEIEAAGGKIDELHAEIQETYKKIAEQKAIMGQFFKQYQDIPAEYRPGLLEGAARE